MSISFPAPQNSLRPLADRWIIRSSRDKCRIAGNPPPRRKYLITLAAIGGTVNVETTGFFRRQYGDLRARRSTRPRLRTRSRRLYRRGWTGAVAGPFSGNGRRDEHQVRFGGVGALTGLTFLPVPRSDEGQIRLSADCIREKSAI